MAIDIKTKLAQLRAAKSLGASNKNESNNIEPGTEIVSSSNSSLAESISNNTLPIVQINTEQNSIKASDTVPHKYDINTSSNNTSTHNIDHLEFLSKLDSLKESLDSAHPTLPILLSQIHKQLKQDPEIVTILSDEQIGIIVKGLQVQTKTELIAVTATKSKASKKAPLDISMF